MIGDDGLLVYPTVPSCSRLRTISHDAMQEFRERGLRLMCLSGVSGLPQITIPLAQVHGAPMGVSLLGPRGSDRRLIDIAATVLTNV